MWRQLSPLSGRCGGVECRGWEGATCERFEAMGGPWRPRVGEADSGWWMEGWGA